MMAKKESDFLKEEYGLVHGRAYGVSFDIGKVDFPLENGEIRKMPVKFFTSPTIELEGILLVEDEESLERIMGEDYQDFVDGVRARHGTKKLLRPNPVESYRKTSKGVTRELKCSNFVRGSPRQGDYKAELVIESRTRGRRNVSYRSIPIEGKDILPSVAPRSSSPDSIFSNKLPLMVREDAQSAAARLAVYKKVKFGAGPIEMRTSLGNHVPRVFFPRLLKNRELAKEAALMIYVEGKNFVDVDIELFQKYPPMMSTQTMGDIRHGKARLEVYKGVETNHTRSRQEEAQVLGDYLTYRFGLNLESIVLHDPGNKRYLDDTCWSKDYIPRQFGWKFTNGKTDVTMLERKDHEIVFKVTKGTNSNVYERNELRNIDFRK